MEAESGENVLEKDLSDVCSGGSFVARAKNYPLREAMVYHDQDRVVAVGEGKIHDEIHGDLLEGASAFGRDRGQGGVGRVSVHFIGLAGSAAGDESTDESGHSRPPVIFLEKGDGVEISAVGSHEGFMDMFDEGVSGRFRDIEATPVVEGAVVKVPVLGGGAR